MSHPEPPHGHGLAEDLQRLMTRRRALALFGLGAAGVLTGCASSSGSGSGDTTTAATTGAAATATGAAATTATLGPQDPIPEETAGPYPGDGSNGPNVLDDTGIVRADIRPGFDGARATAAGVVLTVTMALVDTAGTPLAGRAVYIWHCDREGRYSLYDAALTGENYLRGVRAAGDDGKVTFTTVFPGCYAGRWPHIHFEVYAGLDDAVASGPIVATSQIALPQAECERVYATAGYETSLANLGGISLRSDNVFGEDGGVRQLATMTSARDGYTATLTVPIAV